MLEDALTPSGKTCCIILARGGSKGIPKKNLKKISGISLVARSIRAGRAAESVAAVYVSTDDRAIADEARIHGARIIQRPEALSGDSVSSEAGWLQAVPQIRADFPDLERLVFLQCTSPFTTGDDINACLMNMAALKADCALSVIPDHSFLWGLDNNGFGIGINHNEKKQRERRQDLPLQYRESGAIYCINAALFERTGQRFSGSVAMHPVDHPPVEIDTFADLELCRMIAQNSGNNTVSAHRLEPIKAIVMDFDGVHTDNLVFTDQNGQETVRTSRGDGMGLSHLRDSGKWQMMILSKERNPVVLKRAEKLKLEVQHAVDDKVAALDTWLQTRGLGWENLLYVGNDINDYAAMEKAGLSACPSDSHPTILGRADWILPYPGGKGALRNLSDTLMAAEVVTRTVPAGKIR